MTQIPLGAERPIPKTKNQATRLFSNDKIKNFTKIKLQEYVQSFFNKGVNFDLLSAVSPRFINYNTSKSFDPKTDPTQRRLQVARYFNELHEIIPAILIVDGGINTVPSNIGLISDVQMEKNNVWRGFYPIVKKIPITILAAARDVDEADEMSGILSLMFNEMRNLAGGQYICGDQDRGEGWVISLPNEPVDVGALSQTDIAGEPVEKIWYTEMAFEVMFEDTLAVKEQTPQVELKGVIIKDPDLRQTKKPIIHVPDKVNINEQPIVYIENFQDSFRIILSNSKVATITPDLRLTPRTFGKVTLKIVDDKYPEEGSFVEKEIEII